MNFRKLLTYLAVGTAAVIPFAGAQNPTILQGNYISNVFGQSNFILNPNAQTNVANVTVSSATVTRSTTTPLVATSEFNITTSTATGYADWATRTFDAGMKNQNCEARFTYRGFSVGSTTVQIRQGSNTVAQLTLTASTDPRIASINFPCGDLSSATTLRVQQATAALTGTNELSGLYLGLATNQANVAQAELVVKARLTTSQALSATASTVIFNTKDQDIYGEYNSTTGIFTAKRAGNYMINSSLQTTFGSWANGEYLTIEVIKNNTSTIAASYSMTEASIATRRFVRANVALISLAVGDTVKIISAEFSTGSFSLDGGVADNYFEVYRFPTSSELVVTPERQNTWGSKKFTSAGSSIILFNGVAPSATITTFNSSAITQANSGKCGNTTTANDIGCKITAMPTGSFKVTFDGFLRTYTPGAGGDTNCVFDIYETTTASIVATHSAVASGQANANYAEGKNITGVFNNTSLADRNFVIRAKKQGGATNGYCQFYTDAADIGQMIVQPLDQPSNSALYVQGPVKAAATGDAIAAGYVGEVKFNSESFTGLPLNPTNYGAATTLTPGVWLVNLSGSFQGTAPTNMIIYLTDSSNTQIYSDSYGMPTVADLGNNAVGGGVIKSMFVLKVTSSTTYKVAIIGEQAAGATNAAYFQAIRLN